MKRFIDQVTRAVVYMVLVGACVLALAAAVWALARTPEQWLGAVVASQCTIGVASAAVARRGPEADRRVLLGRVARWDLADTRADLDVVGPITGETPSVDAPLYDFEDADTIPFDGDACPVVVRRGAVS